MIDVSILTWRVCCRRLIERRVSSEEPRVVSRFLTTHTPPKATADEVSPSVSSHVAHIVNRSFGTLLAEKRLLLS